MYKIDRAFMDGNPRYISTRIGFGEGLVQAGEKDNNVVALCADLTESIQMQDFKNKFGNRFIEVGVALGRGFLPDQWSEPECLCRYQLVAKH